MSENIKTISLLILWLVSLTTTKADHLVTNVVKCASVYYYGIRADGGITEQVSCECKSAHFENSMHDGKHPEWVTVFKTSVRVQPTVCWRAMDGVAGVQPAGPRNPKLPQVTPPMPIPLPAKSLPQAAPSADTTPPTVTEPTIRQSTINDFPYATPMSWRCRNNLGMFYDELGTGVTSNRLELSYFAQSNHCYVVWYSNTIRSTPTNWMEFPEKTLCIMSTNGPSRSNTVYLPVMPQGQRFYWLRNS